MRSTIKIASILAALLIYTSQASINVPKCTGAPTPTIKPFHYTTNGTEDSTTTAHMCHDDQYLHVYWFSIDD